MIDNPNQSSILHHRGLGLLKTPNLYKKEKLLTKETFGIDGNFFETDQKECSDEIMHRLLRKQKEFCLNTKMKWKTPK
jgi:hypothetical protein